MRRTTRILLVGEGALKFARAHGFPEENHLTERARKIWLYWKENAAPKDDWLPAASEVDDPDLKWFITKYGDSMFRPTGTIHLPSAPTVRWLLHDLRVVLQAPGRVGDSPLTAAGSTGTARSVPPADRPRRERDHSCGAHTVVELMRQGKSPRRPACDPERVVANTRVAWLKDAPGSRRT
jgi:N4-(beta-N-acetylglucosaminyl)-L-asparaginase